MSFFVFRHAVEMATSPPSLRGQQLIEAIAAIRQGREPSGDTLRTAPLLTRSEFVKIRDAWFLYGLVSGHPKLADGPVFTSVVCAVGFEQQAWARTRSRFYRLGKPWDGGQRGFTSLGNFTAGEV